MASNEIFWWDILYRDCPTKECRLKIKFSEAWDKEVPLTRNIGYLLFEHREIDYSTEIFIN